MSKTTFYRHKRLFYDPRAKQWTRADERGSGSPSGSEEEEGGRGANLVPRPLKVRSSILISRV